MKEGMKKIVGVVLTTILVMCLMSVAPANRRDVSAATGNKPSVTAYATKADLMTVFTPNAGGTADNIGKIILGKNCDGNPLEWYILGKDSGVSGDNTAIFATSHIAKRQKFNESYDDVEYEGTMVYANHYGASNLRATLINLATDTSYFTEKEQSLMQATTVSTVDAMGTLNYTTYTTTDVLYALNGDTDRNKKIYAGSNDEKVLAMSTYWNETKGTMFWLRSPIYNDESYYAVVANPGYSIFTSGVNIGYLVRPASNLNLTNVLFASSATVATDTVVSGTIAEGTAMTLRLDGSDKGVGNVTYNNVTGAITATKDSSATGNVTLVVQGNDGANDWYYSKVINGTEKIYTDDIIESLSSTITLSEIQLDNCEIWLEITEDGVSYAKKAVLMTAETEVGSTEASLPTESSTKTPVETQTKAPVEAQTNAPTAPTEGLTEASTEAPTKPSTEASTGERTEAPTEAPTEASTEASSEAETTEEVKEGTSSEDIEATNTAADENNTEELSTEATSTVEDDGDDNSKGNNRNAGWIIWLVVGIIAIVVIIFLILFFKKKKEDEEENQ